MQKQQEAELLRAFRELSEESRDYHLFTIQYTVERERASRPGLRLVSSIAPSTEEVHLLSGTGVF